jgi:hypothetical protein
VNFLGRSSKTTSKIFIKPQPVAEDLFHADTQRDGWADRHCNVTVRFLKPLLDFNDTRIFKRNFRKLKTILYKLFSAEGQTERGTDRERDRQREGRTERGTDRERDGQREGQTERGTDIMKRISQFRYTITNALHIYKKPAKFLAFLQTVEPTSHYSLSGQQSYTRGPLTDTNTLSSENTILKYYVEIQSFWISLRHCLVALLVTLVTLSSWHFLFE